MVVLEGNCVQGVVMKPGAGLEIPRFSAVSLTDAEYKSCEN